MRYLSRSILTGLSLTFLILIVGCGDAASTDIEEAEEKLEEARQQLEDAKKVVEESKAAAEQKDAELAAYLPPPDFIEPFDVSFGFGDAAEVAHFWRWNHAWTFTEERARNEKWNNLTFLACRYMVSGDFSIRFTGMMSKSFSNSSRPHLHICGQKIKLISSWKKSNLDVSVLRVGGELSYTINNQPPVIVQLDSEQSGPTEVYLRFHNRHATIRSFDLVAESAERVVPSDLTP